MDIRDSGQHAADRAPNPEFTTLNLSGSEPNFAPDAGDEQRDRVLSGANWFLWIAALSLVNSVISVMGGEWGFIVGLGVTQVIDALAHEFSGGGGTITAIAFVLDLLVAGVFAVFGLQARKGQAWAFVVGMILYTLDGLIFVFIQDWLGVAFHLLALYFVFQGLRANNQLKRAV